MAFVEITVEIRNAEAEKARILQTGKIVQTGLQVAVEKIAAYIQSAAQGICPVRTGFLRGSIIILMGKRIAVISATAPYAEFVEYGTSKMAARAFMRSAEGIGAGMADSILRECVGV